MTQLAAQPIIAAPALSFVDWAISCLHRNGGLEDRAVANRWFMTRVPTQERRVIMSALFPGQNPWD